MPPGLRGCDSQDPTRTGSGLRAVPVLIGGQAQSSTSVRIGLNGQHQCFDAQPPLAFYVSIRLLKKGPFQCAPSGASETDAGYVSRNQFKLDQEAMNVPGGAWIDGRVAFDQIECSRPVFG